MAEITCKFGGTSMANAEQIRRVLAIVRENPSRRYIVVSAPGKQGPEDRKITDLLYQCHENASRGRDFAGAFRSIRDRFLKIARDLGLSLDMEGLLAEVERAAGAGAARDFIASRGEYLAARAVAECLDARFIEPAETIRLTAEGSIEEATYARLGRALQGRGLFVVPGFYGAGAGGGVQTFSRGGSDITGAIVARASGSGIYENWTDVCGFLMADPRVVADPKPMRRLTYGEMRRLASMGANVFHEDAVFPVLAAGIPVNIRNTNLPEDPGTLVVAERDDGGGVVGIAGKRDRVGLILEKAMLNLKRDLLKRLLEVLEGLGLHPEALGLSADAVRLILSGSELKDREAVLEQRLRQELGPDRFELESGLALIACVGQGIAGNPGVLARLFLALEREGIGLKLVSAGTTELGILIGVNDRDFEQALRSIYREFA